MADLRLNLIRETFINSHPEGMTRAQAAAMFDGCVETPSQGSLPPAKAVAYSTAGEPDRRRMKQLHLSLHQVYHRLDALQEYLRSLQADPENDDQTCVLLLRSMQDIACAMKHIEQADARTTKDL